MGANSYSPLGRHDLGPCVLVRMVQVDIVIHAHLVLLAIVVLPTEQKNVCAVFLQAAGHISSDSTLATLVDVIAMS